MKEGAVVTRPAATNRVDSSTDGSHGYTGIEKEVFGRLLGKGIPEVVSDPDGGLRRTAPPALRTAAAEVSIILLNS